MKKQTKGRERKNAHEGKAERRQRKEKRSRGRLPSPLARYARERKQVKLEPETAAKSDGTKPARNSRSKLSIKRRRANYGKQMKSRVRHLA